jgi:hypothetical protein
MRWAALLFSFALVAGCSCGRDRPPGSDAGRADAGGFDAPSFDAPVPGDGGTDAASDAADAPAIDAPVDGGRDAPPVDAPAIDAGADGGTDAPVASTLIECMPPVPPGATAGIVFSPMFWSGFRFQITAAGGSRIVRAGLQVRPEPGPGTAFAGLVRLTDMNDVPDDPALRGADVLDVETIALPASATSVIVEAAFDIPVPPGWYAVVFGTGAFGATLPSGSIPSAGGGGCRLLPSGTYPFTIRQSDGMFILQGAEPHMFVGITAP